MAIEQKMYELHAHGDKKRGNNQKKSSRQEEKIQVKLVQVVNEQSSREEVVNEQRTKEEEVVNERGPNDRWNWKKQILKY
jgi:hypothetical protein